MSSVRACSSADPTGCCSTTTEWTVALIERVVPGEWRERARSLQPLVPPFNGTATARVRI